MDSHSRRPAIGNDDQDRSAGYGFEAFKPDCRTRPSREDVPRLHAEALENLDIHERKGPILAKIVLGDSPQRRLGIPRPVVGEEFLLQETVFS